MPVTSQGQVFALNPAGFGAEDYLTQMAFDPATDAVPDVSNPMRADVNPDANPKANYTVVLLGCFALLVALGYAVKHEKSDMKLGHTDIGVYNFLATGLMATLFIVTSKTLLNKYPVTGLTQIVNVA